MTILLWGLALIIAGGLVAAALQRRGRLGDGLFATFVTIGCVTGSVPAVRVLLGTPSESVQWQSPGPVGAWVFGIDPLAAVFVLVVLGVGLANALYGIAYLRPERGHRPVGVAHLLTVVLLASLVGVVTARAAMPFLIAWEIMALSAYFLVTFEDERVEVRRAGLVYLAATHTGTLALFAMFAVWGSRAGGFTFEAFAAAGAPAAGAVVLGLGLFGFGLKAGLVPLHFWLPDAHASAPSHVSGLLSGVVIKMGVYGLLRVLSLLGAPPAWWGWLLLILGVVSGVLGVVWALAQHDLKRLLAYHSIENIGIILIGMGVGALGVTYHRPAVALLGVAGAILHTANHALFKSLLFLGAGVVGRATGTRMIDQLGGIARRMPWTWAAFLIGSVAIVGLPPLNGFVSEWLVYQALLHGAAPETPLRTVVLAVPGLALIGGLALACFAKVGGVVFLGQARSAAAERGQEVGGVLRGAMFGLAVACCVIGLFPGVVAAPILLAAGAVAQVPPAAREAIGAAVFHGAAMITLASAGLVLALAGGWVWFRLVERRRPARLAETWGCAYATPSARMQYTASSFAAPLVGLAGALAGVRTHRSPGAFATHAEELVLGGLVEPGWRRIRALAERLRPMHHGRLHSYLLYLITVVVALLLYLWARSNTT